MQSSFPLETIQTTTAISRSRLMECCRAYRESDVEALADHRQGGNNFKLSKHQVAEVKTKLHQYSPRSLFGPSAATPTGQFWTLSDLKRAMEAHATIEHLQALLAAYPNRCILLFWDRAPWHTSEEVKAFLQRNGRIEVVPFPVGAPDLNPQEHVWKLVRRAVEHNHDLSGIGALADAFEAELRSRTFASSFFIKYGGNVVCPFLE